MRKALALMRDESKGITEDHLTKLRDKIRKTPGPNEKAMLIEAYTLMRRLNTKAFEPFDTFDDYRAEVRTKLELYERVKVQLEFVTEDAATTPPATGVVDKNGGEQPSEQVVSKGKVSVESKVEGIILIDGQNQTPGDDGGRLVRAEDRGEYGYALADATTTYAGAQKVLRHVVFLKPRTFVVLDEIVTAAAADIQSLLHPATLRTEVEGNVIRIRGKDQSSLLVHMLLPESVVVRRDRHEGREPFLRLSAPASSAHAQFLTVLYPLRDADPQPKIGLATQGDDLVVHVEAGARRWEVTFAGLARAEATEAGTGVTDVSVLVRNAP